VCNGRIMCDMFLQCRRGVVCSHCLSGKDPYFVIISLHEFQGESVFSFVGSRVEVVLVRKWVVHIDVAACPSVMVSFVNPVAHYR
jgi:hypothetical protein